MLDVAGADKQAISSQVRDWERSVYLYESAYRLFVSMVDAGISPARERMQREGPENDELIFQLTEVWADLTKQRPADFPWSRCHSTLVYIRIRKRMTNSQKKPLAMVSRSLFAPESGHVYFIVERGCLEFVKIGFSSKAPRVRQSELQTGNPRELEIAAWMPGTKDTERALHIRFATDRVRHNGEWFRFTDDIKQYMTDHCGGF